MYQINPFFGAVDFGTLVMEVHFEDSPDTGSYDNSAALGPTQVDLYLGGTCLSSAQAYDGAQSAHLISRSISTPNNLPDLLIGTANFRMSLFAYFLDVTSGPFGQGLFMFDTAAGITPVLYLAAGTGYVSYSNNGALSLTSTTAPSLSTWHELWVERFDVVTSFGIDETTLGSAADTSNYITGGNTLRIGAFGNTAGPLADAYVDNIRFYNGNV